MLVNSTFRPRHRRSGAMPAQPARETYFLMFMGGGMTCPAEPRARDPRASFPEMLHGFHLQIHGLPTAMGTLMGMAKHTAEAGVLHG